MSKTAIDVLVPLDRVFHADTREQTSFAVIPDRFVYEPGSEARLLLLAPFAPAEALLTVHRQGVVERRRFRIEQTNTVTSIKMRGHYFPHADVHVNLVGQQRVENRDGSQDSYTTTAHGEVRLKLAGSERRLTIEPSESSRAALPAGKPFKLKFSVTDGRGRAVAGARVALSAIEKPVFDRWEAWRSRIREREPLAALFEGVRGDTDQFSSWGHLPSRHATTPFGVRLAPRGPVPKPLQKTKRWMFELSRWDESWWRRAQPPEPAETKVQLKLTDARQLLPNLTTNSAGQVEATLTLPRGATRYRVLVVASYGKKQFGELETILDTKALSPGAKSAVQAKPTPPTLEIRAPTFARTGDRFSVLAALHNPATQELEVDVGVRAEGARVEGSAAVRVTLDPGEHVVVPFPVVASTAGLMRFAMIARDTATSAKGTLTAQASLDVLAAAAASAKTPALEPVEQGFSVMREYVSLDQPDDVKRDPDGTWRIKLGTRVTVKTVVYAPDARNQVELLDEVAAGFEPIVEPPTSRRQSEYYVKKPEGQPPRPRAKPRTLRYETSDPPQPQVMAEAKALPPGVYARSYAMTAAVPGTFVVPPTRVREKQRPETFARSGVDRVVIH